MTFLKNTGSYITTTVTIFRVQLKIFFKAKLDVQSFILKYGLFPVKPKIVLSYSWLITILYSNQNLSSVGIKKSALNLNLILSAIYSYIFTQLLLCVN